MRASDIYLASVSQEEIEAALSEPMKAVVGTINPDGSIHLAFVIFLWEEGKFYFETNSMTRKAKNVVLNSTASFAIDPPDFMAMAEGQARLIEGDQAHAINQRLRAKYMSPERAATVGAAWGSIDDVSVEITPTKWRSWDGRPFAEFSELAAANS